MQFPRRKLTGLQRLYYSYLYQMGEETGWIPEKVEHLYTMYPTPGYTNEKIYIYRAEGVREGTVHPDEDEFLTAAFYPVEEVAEMIRDGSIRDAKTIIAVQRYLLEHQDR